MTTKAEDEAGISVSRKANVTNGPPCPGTLLQEGRRTECGRPAVHVVEDRSMYKCAYGHRWRRG